MSGVDRVVGNPQAMFEYQPPAVLNQAAPVNGDWYTILAATALVRVYGVTVNIEDDNEDLEVQITIDGELIGAVAVTATNSTNYFVIIYGDAIARVDRCTISATLYQGYEAFLCEGHNVEVEVRKITANGTGNLTGIVLYGVLAEC